MPSHNPPSIISSVDFSEQSRHALRWAAALAARFGSRLTVVSVVDPLLAEAARVKLGQDLADATGSALREFVGGSWTGTSPAPAEIGFRTAVGDAATSIFGMADAEDADLIVMGTQGLGGFRKWLLGSTTERLLRRTKVPVLAIPSPDDGVGGGADAISHVLAASDFSGSSIAAVRIAAQWARAFSAKLTLLHIVEAATIPPQWRSLVGDSDETRIASARAKLRALREEVCDRGRASSPAHRDGSGQHARSVLAASRLDCLPGPVVDRRPGARRATN